MKKIFLFLYVMLCFLVSCDEDAPSFSQSGMDCPHCENGTGYIMNDFGNQVGTCEYCEGTGYLKYVNCYLCGGSGYAKCSACFGLGDCTHCGGSGEIESYCYACDNEGGQCYVCDGYGYTSENCYWCYDGACSSCRGTGSIGVCSYCDGYGYWYVDKFGNMYW